MSKILLVEDDETLGTSLKKYLEAEGMSVTLAKKIAEARTHVSDAPDIMILDWMLPDGQGIDFLKDIRQSGERFPVIMLTARTDLIDKVIGLESGASDYLTKPFEPRELMARIRVQERHLTSTPSSAEKTEAPIRLGELVIDSVRREIHFKKQEIEMTKMEFDFLRLLAENPNRAFTREEILNKVWGYENYPSTRTVDTHVLQIRQKLYDELIETVRGVGYRLRFND
jgi:DNA-binding response OmpR family regulator